jgi:hypothetical protein
MPLTPVAVSLEQELESAFANAQMVVKCWEPECSMHRLPHWAEAKWVAFEAKHNYRRYSHGICNWHYLAYQREIDQILGVEKAESGEPALAVGAAAPA